MSFLIIFRREILKFLGLLCDIERSAIILFSRTILVVFYGISTLVGYLMPNPLYTSILDIYDLVWLGFMAYQPL